MQESARVATGVAVALWCTGGVTTLKLMHLDHLISSSWGILPVFRLLLIWVVHSRHSVFRETTVLDSFSQFHWENSGQGHLVLVVINWHETA
jgi:hypothetical protein